MSDEFFFSRWSRLKRESREPPKEKPGEAPAAGKPEAKAPAAPGEPAKAVEKPPLPPVESLTPESDFAGFMHEGVDPMLRRQALKTLFRDPRFNVMDGLDVYIDDYSQPDPLPAGWLEKLNQTARLGEYREPDEKAPEPPMPDAPPEGEVAGQESEQDQGARERPETGEERPAPTPADDAIPPSRQ